MHDGDKYCLNCKQALDSSAEYCPACGQKESAKLLSVNELLSNLWNSIFNFDNTIFRTLRYIFQPWKLTQFYVEGRRKDFLNPMRLFLVTLLFHFSFLVSLTNINHNSFKSSVQQAKIEQSNLLKKFNDKKDSLALDANSRIALDSMQSYLFKDVVLPEQDTFFPSSIFFEKKIGITNYDAVNLPLDSLYKKYHITSFKDKLVLKQLIKVNFDRNGMTKFGIRNAAWGVFLLVFLLAALMKLLYFRQNHHYVAHLVFNLNLHSVIFLIVSILFIIFNWLVISENSEEMATGLALIVIPIYIWYSFYKNYKQPVLKTTIKFFVWGFIYVFFGLLLIILAGVSSLLFF